MIVPAPKPRRRNETRELTQPIRAALNAMPGVRVFRNNSGALPLGEGGFLRFGLGEGSCDLIGIVRVVSCCCERPDEFCSGQDRLVGRFFALEIKRPGKKPDADQLAWMAAIRSLGGFACVVTSVEEARDAVERCRSGDSE
jgi:hypothetical protein